MDNRIINIDNAELVIQQDEIIINENAAVPRNEPANIEEDNQLPRNPDGSLDGGIVVPVDSKKTNANECDLVSIPVTVQRKYHALFIHRNCFLTNSFLI
jgi:hypothetical protein